MNEIIANLTLIALIMVGFWFLLIRPQRKKDNEINTMRNNLQAGDEVITIGGIIGKIVKVKDETIVLQIGADKVRFEATRWSISKVTKPAKKKHEDEEEQPKKVDPQKIKRLKNKENEENKEAEAEKPEINEAEAATEPAEEKAPESSEAAPETPENKEQE